MDILNLVGNIYKNELADANEKRVVLQVQCEQYKQKIEQLEQELKSAKDEIEKIKNTPVE